MQDIDLTMLESIALEGLTQGGTPEGTAGIPAPRSARAPLSIVYVRDLSGEDLMHLQAEVGEASGTDGTLAPRQTLAKIRTRHHNLAKLVADGLKDAQVAVLTSYTPGYIASLRSDPMFRELVAYYAAGAEAKYLDMHSRRAEVGTMAVERLRERLDDDELARTIATKTLVEIAEFGHGDKLMAKGQGLGGAGVGTGANGGVTVNISFPTDREGAGQGAPTIELEANKGDQHNG